MQAYTKFEQQVVAILTNKKYTGNIKFTLLNRKVEPSMFQDVAAAIKQNRIQVRWVDKNSKVPGDGLYDAARNTFYIRDTTSDIGDLYSLIVHESVHAYSDLVKTPRDTLPEEFIAYVAGSVCLHNLGKAKDPVIYDLAMLGLGSKLKYHKKKQDLINGVSTYIATLKDSSGHNVYNLKAQYQFDGVPK
ncbi:hypothetical protein ETAA8_01880 [Anatilimnocola aggregata]|uniref:Uncharacterized protein n=1 Tax=Anatilimnocola aggregata TaxID=2528021 RepID=A0A517Y4I2_9BACT|nr:hypothetical protein [Anatilimnocola aggregata]QDU25127.1 hypothetical protein ETAA8_01880 [Anatilimnocola aggregata]